MDAVNESGAEESGCGMGRGESGGEEREQSISLASDLQATLFSFLLIFEQRCAYEPVCF